MTVVRYCPNCGTQSQTNANFCTSCGAGLSADDGNGPYQPNEAPAYTPTTSVSRYRISPDKIVVMSVLSWGIYLFYWFYLTWKQYRDHTQLEAFPVWHATAIGAVPIYSLFRVHAHMRSFRELMLQAGQATSISAGRAVGFMIAYTVLSGVSFAVAELSTSYMTAVMTLVTSIGSVAVVIILLYGVQKDLNRYWREQSGGTLVNARFGTGEVVLSVIGVILWADTIASLLSESYRLGQF